MHRTGYVVLAIWTLTTAAWADTPAPAPAAGSVTQSMGGVTFTVDGVAKAFDHLPDGDNRYTPLASTIRAMPSAGAREQLSITFLSIDLRQQPYPGQLPPPRGRGAGVNPLAAMANVGFSYVDGDGREWAGPGAVSVEAFGSDGVIVGTFSGISLPHTEKALPAVTLTDGTFRARLSAPW